MKQLLTVSILFIILSCKKSENTTMIQQTIPQKQIPKTNQYIYGLDVTFYNPYDIYINNILIAQDSAGAGELVDLRPWLLHNGTYTITIKLTPSKDNKYLEFLEGLKDRISFVQFLEDTEGGLDKSTMIEQDLPLLTQDNMPYLEQSWDIEITNLPYELEGWRNGQDLSKWDKGVLQKKVVAYYEKLRTVLNNGDADGYNRFCLQRDAETNVFLYKYDIEKIQEKFKKNSRRIREYAKDNMVPIENYTMKIYGKNNQLVNLERIDEGNKGEGVLRTLEPDGAIRIYNIKLYLPKNSDEFVIIRK